MINNLQAFLDKYDLKGRTIPAARLKDLERDYNEISDKGLIDSKLEELYLRNFSFSKPEGLEDFNSLVILSMARPIHRLGINYKGKKIKVLLPPTYINYQKINQKIFKLFRDWMNSAGYRVFTARLPLKLLSVRSGLAKYGKNNISYIGKWGSFHQLFGFFTDIKADTDPWQDMEALDACKTCTLCIRNCPTGAIKKDRFLLDAARCLTFLNESEEDIPPWVDPQVHNSLIGCMRCQDVCPYDRKLIKWIEDIGELDGKETEMLLDYDEEKDKDSPLIGKYKELGIHEFLDLVPRNLRLLLKKIM
jgi:epoxyqueuosine reductase